MVDNNVKTLTSYHALKVGRKLFHTPTDVQCSKYEKNNIFSVPFLLYNQFSFIYTYWHRDKAGVGGSQVVQPPQAEQSNGQQKEYL